MKIYTKCRLNSMSWNIPSMQTHTQLVVFHEITISLFTLLVTLPFCRSNKNTYRHTHPNYCSSCPDYLELGSIWVASSLMDNVHRMETIIRTKYLTEKSVASVRICIKMKLRWEYQTNIRSLLNLLNCCQKP